MLISGVRRSCTPIWHRGLRWALDDVYSLWEVVQFPAPKCAFVQQFCPPLPSLLAGHCRYTGWSISPLSFSVLQCLVVVAALWVAVDTCVPCKAILPTKFDAGHQLKYNVQRDWSNQVITVYLIGQFKPVKWYDIISLQWNDIISLHGYHFYSWLYHTDIHTYVIWPFVRANGEGPMLAMPAL